MTIARVNGTTRFQTLSGGGQPVPSGEIDAEINLVVTEVNKMFKKDGTDPMTGPLKIKKGADVAAASNLFGGSFPTDGNCFDITGNTGIATITASGRTGTFIILHFTGAPTLTHSADLDLPNGVNITIVAGDVMILYEYATGDWRLVAGMVGSMRATPVITSFASATHDHSNEAGGGLNTVHGPGPFNVRSNFDNLVAKKSAAGTVDIDADWFMAYAADGTSVKIAGLNITIDMANGAGALLGLAGAGIEDNVWYHLWVLSKIGGTPSGFFVVEADNTLATVLTRAGAIDGDYDYAVYVGAIKNTAGDFDDMYQRNGKVRAAGTSFGTLNSTVGNATIDLSTVIPTTAKHVKFVWGHDTADRCGVHPEAFTEAIGVAYWQEAGAASGRAGECVIETAQTLSYGVGGGAGTMYVWAWEY